MDSGIIVVIVLTVIAVGAFVWIEVSSRRKARLAEEEAQSQGKGRV